MNFHLRVRPGAVPCPRTMTALTEPTAMSKAESKPGTRWDTPARNRKFRRGFHFIKGIGHCLSLVVVVTVIVVAWRIRCDSRTHEPSSDDVGPLTPTYVCGICWASLELTRNWNRSQSRNWVRDVLGMLIELCVCLHPCDAQSFRLRDVAGMSGSYGQVARGFLKVDTIMGC